MALVSSDNNSWSTEYESCERLHQAISEQMHLRSSEARTSENHARISALIRVRLKQFETELEKLCQSLAVINRTKSVTFEEYERRVRLVENLQSKYIQLSQKFNDRSKISGFRQDKNSLLGNQVVAEGGTTGWGVDDDEYDDEPSTPLLASNRELSINQLRDQQKSIIRDQDAGLENLSRVISRQKEMAVTINNEVDFQNDIVDEISERMDNTTAFSRRETEQIAVILKKDSTWGYWLIILMLFLAIVMVALV